MHPNVLIFALENGVYKASYKLLAVKQFKVNYVINTQGFEIVGSEEGKIEKNSSNRILKFQTQSEYIGELMQGQADINVAMIYPDGGFK